MWWAVILILLLAPYVRLCWGVSISSMYSSQLASSCWRWLHLLDYLEMRKLLLAYGHEWRIIVISWIRYQLPCSYRCSGLCRVLGQQKKTGFLEAVLQGFPRWSLGSWEPMLLVSSIALHSVFPLSFYSSIRSRRNA